MRTRSQSDPRQKLLKLLYLGPVPLPLAEAAGGQGVAFGEVPGVAWMLPEVPGVEPAVFGVELPVAPGVAPGKLPHGDPLGVVPGVFGLFGFTVEGCVLLPGVGGVIEFEPGIADGGEDPVGGGVAVLVGGGVVVLVGGVVGVGAVVLVGVVVGVGAVVLVGGGVAVLVGGAGGVLVCAATQAAQHKTTERRLIFRSDIANSRN